MANILTYEKVVCFENENKVDSERLHAFFSMYEKERGARKGVYKLGVTSTRMDNLMVIVLQCTNNKNESSIVPIASYPYSLENLPMAEEARSISFLNKELANFYEKKQMAEESQQ